MIPRYSFSMLGRNLDLVFKVLIYVFILSLLFIAILVAIINPILKELNSNIDFGGRILQTLEGLMNRENNNVTENLLTDIKVVLGSISSQIVVAVLLALLMVYIIKFFFSLTSVPLGEVIYGRMSQNFSVMFHNVLISSLRQSLLFALINASVTLVADLVIIAACYYLAKLFYLAIGIYGISLAIFIMFALLASRIAIIGQWVPQIVCEKKNAAKAFADSFKHSAKYFRKVMPAIFLVLVLEFSVVTITTFFTFGLLPIIMMPVALVLLNSLNLIAYFTFNKRKFYIDEVTVVNQIVNDDIDEGTVINQIVNDD